ncbi:hypothetical protein GCM10023317_86680 [Actinopolymorpha pittospori]|uniref:Uncharacterized protein n=1 Tax=Actinopolymorpha pittospori TaxID=648752 RepID=A0A927RDY3_9ACTN|nr:hypothetical protein [Actinopolymorpha pittospori]MBE1608625.1 hypothetical protein [Actinopolymorpha pittospori]
MPAGFAAAEATVVSAITTRLETSSDRPARSANAITGTNPAHDTKFCSSNTSVARDH